MANRERNEVDSLFAQYFAYTVCWVAKVPFTGYKLEEFFVGKLKTNPITHTKIRNCKWDRYFSGKRTPSNRTVEDAQKKLPGIKAYMNLPIWDALHTKHKTFPEWQLFYQSLPYRIQKYVFKTEVEHFSDDKRKKISARSLKAIYRQGDILALSCLIALFRESVDSASKSELHCHETLIRNLLVQVCVSFPFYFIRHELLVHIFIYFCSANENNRKLLSPWNFTLEEFDKEILTLQRTGLIAEDLELVSTQRDRKELYYWIYEGDTNLILNELLMAKNAGRWKVLSEDFGLGWLISKLNIGRKADRRLGNVV